MITAEDLVMSLNNPESSSGFKLAEVVGLFENNTAKIKFDGEDVASEKEYAYLDSYVPKNGDRVLLGVLGGTYVILGKVNYNVPPSTEEEIDRYLFDLKQVIMQKGLNVTQGLSVTGTTTLNSGATVGGNVGVNGNINAVAISATGNISGNNAVVAGEVQHNGNKIGFFGASPATKTVLNTFTNPSAFTLENARTGINNIVIALKSYGLF